MRTLDLFAGAGGADLGLRAAGCGVAAAVEWDDPKDDRPEEDRLRDLPGAVEEALAEIAAAAQEV